MVIKQCRISHAARHSCTFGRLPLFLPVFVVVLTTIFSLLEVEAISSNVDNVSRSTNNSFISSPTSTSSNSTTTAQSSSISMSTPNSTSANSSPKSSTTRANSSSSTQGSSTKSQQGSNPTTTSNHFNSTKIPRVQVSADSGNKEPNSATTESWSTYDVDDETYGTSDDYDEGDEYFEGYGDQNYYDKVYYDGTESHYDGPGSHYDGPGSHYDDQRNVEDVPAIRMNPRKASLNRDVGDVRQPPIEPHRLGFFLHVPPQHKLVAPHSSVMLPCSPHPHVVGAWVQWKMMVPYSVGSIDLYGEGRRAAQRGDGEYTPQKDTPMDLRIMTLSNGSLYFREVLPSDPGLYRCLLHSSRGVILAPITKLSIAEIGAWLLQPQSTTGTLGGGVRLFCYLSSAPPAIITWMKDNQPLVLTPRHSTPSTGVLQISPLNKRDAGVYSCLGYNPLLNSTVMSNNATVEVLGKFGRATVSSPPSVANAGGTFTDDEDSVDYEGSAGETNGSQPGTQESSRKPVSNRTVSRTTAAPSYPLKPPVLLPVQNKVEVKIGQRAVLECISNFGSPIARLSWSRTLSTHSLPLSQSWKHKIEGQGNLVIEAVSRADGGQYSCTLTSSLLSTPIVQMVLLTVLSPPTVTLSPSHQVVNNGVTVDISCTASGSPRPKVTWYKDGVQIVQQHGRYFLEEIIGRPRPTESSAAVPFGVPGNGLNNVGQVQLKLVLVSPRHNDSGLYQCVASSRAGQASQLSHMVVRVSLHAPEAPTNVTVTVLSPATSAKVTWNSVTMADSTQKVGYIVYYFSLGVHDDKILEYEILTLMSEVTLKDLNVNEQYSVYLRSFTIVNDSSHPLISEPSETTLFVTKPPKPQSSPSMWFTSMTSTSLHLHWSKLPPAELQWGHPMQHAVLYRRAYLPTFSSGGASPEGVSSSANESNQDTQKGSVEEGENLPMFPPPMNLPPLEQNIKVSGDQFSLNVTGLLPNTEYEFLVLTANEAGYPVNSRNFTWLHVRVQATARTGSAEGAPSDDSAGDGAPNGEDVGQGSPLIVLVDAHHPSAYFEVVVNPNYADAVEFSRQLSWHCWQQQPQDRISDSHRPFGTAVAGGSEGDPKQQPWTAVRGSSINNSGKVLLSPQQISYRLPFSALTCCTVNLSFTQHRTPSATSNVVLKRGPSSKSASANGHLTSLARTICSQPPSLLIQMNQRQPKTSEDDVDSSINQHEVTSEAPNSDTEESNDDVEESQTLKPVQFEDLKVAKHNSTSVLITWALTSSPSSTFYVVSVKQIGEKGALSVPVDAVGSNFRCVHGSLTLMEPPLGHLHAGDDGKFTTKSAAELEEDLCRQATSDTATSNRAKRSSVQLRVDSKKDWNSYTNNLNSKTDELKNSSAFNNRNSNNLNMVLNTFNKRLTIKQDASSERGQLRRWIRLPSKSFHQKRNFLGSSRRVKRSTSGTEFFTRRLESQNWRLIVTDNRGLIGGLAPHTAYSFQVSACTSLHCTTPSPTVWGFTVAGVSTPPRDVQWRPLSASQVLLSWLPPVLTVGTLPSHYRLTFSSNGKHWRELTVPYNTTSAELDFIVSNTNYSVFIAAAVKKRQFDVESSISNVEPLWSSSFDSPSKSQDKVLAEDMDMIELNDDPFWEEPSGQNNGKDEFGSRPREATGVSDDESSFPKAGTFKTGNEEWESVGEWASAEFIVHAVIVSEAEKWTSSAHTIIVTVVSIAVALTTVTVIVLCCQMMSIKRSASTVVMTSQQQPPPVANHIGHHTHYAPSFPCDGLNNPRLILEYSPACEPLLGGQDDLGYTPPPAHLPRPHPERPHHPSGATDHPNRPATQPLLHSPTHGDFRELSNFHPLSHVRQPTQMIPESYTDPNKGQESQRSLDTAAIGTEGSSGFSSVADPDDNLFSRCDDHTNRDESKLSSQYLCATTRAHEDGPDPDLINSEDSTILIPRDPQILGPLDLDLPRVKFKQCKSLPELLPMTQLDCKRPANDMSSPRTVAHLLERSADTLKQHSCGVLPATKHQHPTSGSTSVIL